MKDLQQEDIDSPYRPPRTISDDVNDDFISSRWLLLLALLLATPPFLLGGFGLYEEILQRANKATAEFLYGFFLALGLLLCASSPLVVRDIAQKFYQKSHALAMRRIAGFAFAYGLPFLLSFISRTFFAPGSSDRMIDLGLPTSLAVSIIAFGLVFLIQMIAMAILYCIMHGILRMVNSLAKG